ncbi:hypothetical protein D3C81_1793900 [compost metagenome]
MALVYKCLHAYDETDLRSSSDHYVYELLEQLPVAIDCLANARQENTAAYSFILGVLV